MTAPHRSPLLTATALALGVAISLGMARFAFALLLAPMRDDLQWSYALAGSLNVVNAAGYLAGALVAPMLMHRTSAQWALTGGAILTSLFTLLCGLTTHDGALLLLRAVSGATSAWVFVAGGLLTARLGSQHPQQSGLLLGIYYGGAGLGIVLSSLLVPWAIEQAGRHAMTHTWQAAWWALAAGCALATALMAGPARTIDGLVARPGAQGAVRRQPLTAALVGYFMFGVGYIGYMTFIIALLKKQDMPATVIVWFYTLLGLGCMASSRLWSGMLDRYRGGESLALLNGLLGLATLIPAFTRQPVAVFASGILFGSVFLSVVASTTALVKHNLPAAQWPGGIALFTVTFAFGQILGPGLTGVIADSQFGLEGGLVFSAAALLFGSAVAWQQKPLPLAVAGSALSGR